MFGGLGVTELLVILAIILIIFGAGKLPQAGQSMGKAFKNFKKEVSSDTKDEKDEDKDEDKKDSSS